MEKEVIFKISRGNVDKLGTARVKGGINFAVGIPDGKEAALVLLDEDGKSEAGRFELPISERYGDVASLLVACPGTFKYAYRYEIEGEPYLDPYADRIADGLCYVDSGRFDWEKCMLPGSRCTSFLFISCMCADLRWIRNQESETKVPSGVLFTRSPISGTSGSMRSN